MDRYQKRVLKLREHVLNNNNENNKATEQPTKHFKEDNKVIAYEDITKSEISKLLAEKDIEHNDRDTKQELYDLLLGSD